MLDPRIALIVAIIAGIGALVSYESYELAKRVGPMITAKDLLPVSPGEGLPVPRLFKMPEVMRALTGKK